MKYTFVKVVAIILAELFLFALVPMLMPSCTKITNSNCYTCHVKISTSGVGYSKDSAAREYKCGMTDNQIERYQSENNYKNVSATGTVVSKQTLCVKQ